MTLTSPCGVIPSLAAGKSLDVAEQHGHDAALTFGGQRRPVDQPFDDARIDIFAEGLAHALLEAQLLDHLIERGGQVADLVLRGDGQRFVETARLDRARALQQPADWTRHAGADHRRKHQTQGRRQATVRIAAMIMTWRCLCTVIAASASQRCASMSARIASIF